MKWANRIGLAPGIGSLKKAAELRKVKSSLTENQQEPGVDIFKSTTIP